jgi:hypothetical protein
MPGPFYFAWVDSSDTTFDPTRHNVYDENIFSFKGTHTEGQVCALQIEIQTPRIGILAAGRKQWAWFSWFNGSEIEPVFFGKLEGVPSDPQADTVTLLFVARALDDAARKQALAETLKSRPYYDPLFLDDAHRDDADSIIEARSALWHRDRITHDVTISDIITGEDGVQIFNSSGGGDVFYDSVKISPGQAPLTTIHVSATVKWTQTLSDTVNLVPDFTFTTVSAQGILSEWPKTGATLSGGYTVTNGYAIDVNQVASSGTDSYSYSYQNTAKTHQDGDTMSSNSSRSGPNFPEAAGWGGLLSDDRTNVIGDPSTGTAASVSIKQSYLVVAAWTVRVGLTVKADAAQARTETITFDLTSDLQSLLTSPNVSGPVTSEILTINGGDVGQPLLNVLGAISVRSTLVTIGQVIRPTDGLSYQIAVNDGGTTAAVEPTFSAITGVATTDGSVTWICIGPSISSTVPNWRSVASSQVARGVVIRADNQLSYQICTTAGTTGSTVQSSNLLLSSDVRGVSVQSGLNIIPDDGLSIQTCNVGGVTDTAEPSFSAVVGVDTVDGQAIWQCLATEPPFSDVLGVTTNDNTVVWTSLGPNAGGYLGTPIGSNSFGSYFPTNRGNWSVEYLIALARAHLLLRARAVTINWTTTWERALGLTLRMSGLIYDNNIPGGAAVGKITQYTFEGNGDTGAFFGTVQIGCAIGKGNAIVLANGTPAYVNAGYVNGHQTYPGAIVALASGDIGYSIPIDPGVGLKSLSRSTVVVRDGWHFDQSKANYVPPVPTRNGGNTISQEQARVAAETQAVNNALASVATWYEIELLALDGKGADAQYFPFVTSLVVDQGIDLTSASW